MVGHDAFNVGKVGSIPPCPTKKSLELTEFAK